MITPASSYYLSPFILHNLRFIKHWLHSRKYRSTISKNSKFKNIHQGKRCFILGSGPSMKTADLSGLATEHVIALNSFFLHPQLNSVLDKKGPQKYYLVPPNHPPQTRQDWIETLKQMEVKFENPLTMFWGIDFNKNNWKDLIEEENLFKGFDLNYFFCGINIRDGYRFNAKHINPTGLTFSASNALINGLAMALYMGFSEIFLLGFEHNHICVKSANEYRFYDSSPHLEKEKSIDFGPNTANDLNFNILANNYFTFKIYLEMETKFPSQKIINLTPGGILDVFRRSHLEDVLKIKKP